MDIWGVLQSVNEKMNIWSVLQPVNKKMDIEMQVNETNEMGIYVAKGFQGIKEILYDISRWY